MASQESQTISLKVLIDKKNRKVGNLEEQFLQTLVCKSILLHPRNLYENECRKLKLNIDDTEPTKYYICADWNCSGQESGSLYTTFKNVRCNCGKMMDNEILMKKEDQSAIPEGDRGVFVCGTTKFMVNDDLQVKPISAATIVKLLHKLGFKGMSSLQEAGALPWFSGSNPSGVKVLMKCIMIITLAT
ncbi:uncharacterized protein LOC122058347 [Macadamia integrifolia]|uniref:uncharacterized protein LOC122058347 n=1 Tax=Macadamia integrifolia TaxID=60698 RepID=UPI001C4E6D64|nr:uncharacterized protein LOC122058347 [Macadamia integrifolia]